MRGLVVALALFAAGCGVKGRPLPPLPPAPAATTTTATEARP